MCFTWLWKIDVSANFTARLVLFALTIDVWSGITPTSHYNLFLIDCIQCSETLDEWKWLHHYTLCYQTWASFQMKKPVVSSSKGRVRDICSTECASLKKSLELWRCLHTMVVCGVWLFHIWRFVVICLFLFLFMLGNPLFWKEMKTTYVLLVEGMIKTAL